MDRHLTREFDTLIICVASIRQPGNNQSKWKALRLYRQWINAVYAANVPQREIVQAIRDNPDALDQWLWLIGVNYHG